MLTRYLISSRKGKTGNHLFVCIIFDTPYLGIIIIMHIELNFKTNKQVQKQCIETKRVKI